MRMMKILMRIGRDDKQGTDEIFFFFFLIMTIFFSDI